MIETTHVSWPGWETIRLIGRGSFGAVYEIQRTLVNGIEKAALKVISIPQNPSDIDEMSSEGYKDEEITTIFQSHLTSIVEEYSLMKKMSGCTNIVNCDDVRYVQHDDGFGWDIFIKMELLTPLTKSIVGEIAEDTVIKIGRDICIALELCKKHEIIHRDIKPQNIFVSQYGDYKLGDFGIAKTVEKTMGGTKIGTYKYMAPEVYNNQPYGTSADIYSLGLVMYWLLNERRMPFMPLPPTDIQAGMEESARERRFSGEQLSVPAHGSEELKWIVLKACAYEPEMRYQNAVEMLNDLNVLSGIRSIPVVDDVEELEESGSQKQESDGDGSETEKKSNKKRIFIIIACVAFFFLNFLILRSCGRDDGHSKEVTGENSTTAVSEQETPTEQRTFTQTEESIASTERVEESLPILVEWTEWLDKLPEYVTKENYVIEEQTLYRSSNLETTTSEKESMEGWELYDVVEGTGEFGNWTAWSAEGVIGSDIREVEMQEWYRYREKKIATGASSSMEGWELYNTTYTLGDYGAWSEWGADEITVSEERQVETKDQYNHAYRSYAEHNEPSYEDYIPNGYSDRITGEWSEWSATPIEEDEYTAVETKNVGNCEVLWAHYCNSERYYSSPNNNTTDYHEVWQSYGTEEPSFDECFMNPMCPNGHNIYYKMEVRTGGEIYTMYRFAPRERTYYFYKDTWTGWTDGTFVAKNDIERLEETLTRTLYRYCDREKIPTYHFYCWGSWSDWSPNAVTESDDRQVETTTFYRYRDRVQTTTYYFKRWGSWSDYSTIAVTADDTTKVETITQYRYKSK